MNRFYACFLAALAGASLQASGGYGLGLQTSIPLGDRWSIVPRLDYLRSTDSTSVAGPKAPISLSSTANIVCLGADCDYSFGADPDRGFFLLAGLGVALADLQVSGSTTNDSERTTSHQTLFYPEAGAGYQFTRHVGVEVLYKDLNFSNVTVMVAGVPAGYAYSGGLSAGVVFRF